MNCKFSGIGKPGIGLTGDDSGIGVWCVWGWSVGLVSGIGMLGLISGIGGDA